MIQIHTNLSQSPLATDKLIDFREVGQRVGLRCQTSHSARALAKRGQIRAVYINDRTIRYSENSVLELVAGRVAPAGRVARRREVMAEITARFPNARSTSQPATPPPTP